MSFVLRALAAVTVLFWTMSSGAGPAWAATDEPIVTVAGGAGPLDPTPATELPSSPTGLVVDGSSVYVGDSTENLVRELDPSGDEVTVAGDNSVGVFGSSHGDGGPATAANLWGPEGMAVDQNGNLLIADADNGLVRVVAGSTGTFYGLNMVKGDIYSIAGSGVTANDNAGPATSAEISPTSVAVDAEGNIVIADPQRSLVRVVAESDGTFYGQAMLKGNIYTIGGNGGDGFSGDGGLSTNAEFNEPEAIAVDSAGNIVVVDSGNDRIRVIVNTSGTFYGQQMRGGDVYTVAGDGTRGYSGDGGPALDGELASPDGIAIDSNGNFVLADASNNVVRLIPWSTGTFYGQPRTAGDIYTLAGNGTQGFAGDGDPAVSAELTDPTAVAVDSTGNVLIADSTHLRVVAAASGSFYGQPMTAGDVYSVAGNGTADYSGDGGPATAGTLDFPTGVAVDASGDVVISDSSNERVRVVAGASGTFFGQQVSVGDIYTVAGNGVAAVSGDGGPAMDAEVEPGDVMFDSSGNLVISDGGRIRVIARVTGTYYGQPMIADDIYTIAGDGTVGYSGDGGPATSAEIGGGGVVEDRFGNLVFADGENSRIRVIAESTGEMYGQQMTAGDIYTIAGTGDSAETGQTGPALSTNFQFPETVAVDPAGNVVIGDIFGVDVLAESSGSFYGVAMTAGDVYNLEGIFKSPFVLEARGVAVDASGNIVFGSETSGNTTQSGIFVIAGSTGTFYDQSMIAGGLYSIAGSAEGFGGDGGPAASAEINTPAGVALDPNGDIYFADMANNRVREVVVDQAPPAALPESPLTILPAVLAIAGFATILWFKRRRPGGRSTS